MPTTTYDIRLRYLLDDKASKGLKGIEDAAEGASHSTHGLGGAIGAVGGMLVGAFGLHEAEKALIGFNAEVQNAKIGLSTMLQGNRGGSWEMATNNAERLYNEFQKFSQLTPVTTQDVMQFGNAVAVATFQAGGGMKDFKLLAEQGTVAAQALGMQADYTSREISEMLMGNVNNRMMFAKQILGMANMTEEAFKKLSGHGRMEVIEKVLGGTAMQNATKAYSESFTGVTSTLKDNLQILLGKVGLPLFKAVTAEVQHWNQYIGENQGKIERMAKALGSDLVDGFRMVKDAVMFLVEHKDLLIKIGEIWLAAKGASMLGGSIGGLMKGAGGLGANVKGVGGAMGSMGQLGAAFSVGYMIGDALNPAVNSLVDEVKKLTGTFDWAADRMQHKQADITAAMDAWDNAVNAAADRARGKGGSSGVDETSLATIQAGQLDLYRKQLAELQNFQNPQGGFAMSQRYFGGGDTLGLADLLSQHGIDAHSNISENSAEYQQTLQDLQASIDKLGSLSETGKAITQGDYLNAVNGLTDYQKDSLNVQKAQQSILEEVVKSLNAGQFGYLDPQRVHDLVAAATDDPTGKLHNSDKLAKASKVNVTIQRIEVKSDDPDRFVFQMIEGLRDAARNPSSALDALREG
jgi:hypothetical protein